MLYPTLALDQFGIADATLQAACFRVYDDWLMEYCSVAPKRLPGDPFWAAAQDLAMPVSLHIRWASLTNRDSLRANDYREPTVSYVLRPPHCL
jgi:hypothetical protein